MQAHNKLEEAELTEQSLIALHRLCGKRKFRGNKRKRERENGKNDLKKCKHKWGGVFFYTLPLKSLRSVCFFFLLNLARMHCKDRGGLTH